MNDFERAVRAHVIRTLLDTAVAPTADEIATTLDSDPGRVASALRSLADQHRLAMLPGSDAVWMAHPFSAVESDFVVRAGDRRWFANCAWDGLAILGLVGDGAFETHCPASGSGLRFTVEGGRVLGDGVIHFLVPAREFWDDIGFT